MPVAVCSIRTADATATLQTKCVDTKYSQWEISMLMFSINTYLRYVHKVCQKICTIAMCVRIWNYEYIMLQRKLINIVSLEPRYKDNSE